MLSGERWFLLAGTGEYPADSQFPKLREVSKEIVTVRSSLRRLGLTDAAPPASDDSERDSLWLRAALGDWLRERREQAEQASSAGLPPADCRLLVYFTGHSFVDGEFYLPGRAADTYEPDRTMITPGQLINLVLASPVVAELVVILDTCYAQRGATEALQALQKAWSGPAADLRVRVIAATTSTVQAKQMAFARALSRSLLDRSLGRTEFIEFDSLLRAINGSLPETQQARQVNADSGVTRMLPNPFYEPPGPPTWIPLAWRAVTRGVVSAEEEGWFFRGRQAALEVMSAHLDGTRAGPLLVCGARGTGKSALLGWAWLTGSAVLRPNIPLPVRRKLPAVRAGLVHSAVRIVSDDPRVAAAIAEDLGLLGVTTVEALLAALAERSEPAGILVDLTVTDSSATRFAEDLLSRLAALPAVRLVIAAQTPAHCAVEAAEVLQLDADPEFAGAEVEAFLTSRRVPAPGGERTSKDDRSHAFNEMNKLAGACGPSFQAAVRALRALPSGLAAAAEEAAEALRVDVERSLHDVGFSAEEVAGVLMPLTELPVPVPRRLWAQLATHLAGWVVTEELVVRVLDRVGSLLRRTGDEQSGFRWQSRRPVVLTATQAVRAADALVALVPTRAGRPSWPEADQFVLQNLPDVAAVAGLARRYLCDPAFLLAARPSARSRAIAAAGSADVSAALRTVCEALRGARPTGRDFLLALLAAKHGPDDLRAAVGQLSLVWRPVVAVDFDDDLATAHGLAVHGGLYGVAVTAHSDGSLCLWRLPTLEVIHRLPPDLESNLPRTLAMRVSQDGPEVALSRPGGRVDLWQPARDALHTIVVDAAGTALAWDETGRLAMPGPDGWCLIDPATGDRQQWTLAQGRADFIELSGQHAAVVAGGTLQHLKSVDGDRWKILHAVRVGAVRSLAISPGGTVVAWADAGGRLGVVGTPTRPLVIPDNPTGLRSLSVSDGCVVAAGGPPPWVRIYDSSVWRPIDLQMDAVPVHSAMVDDTLLVLSAHGLTLVGRDAVTEVP